MKVIVVTDALTGVGRIIAETLALEGHTVYASMRDLGGPNASRAQEISRFANDNDVDLRTIEMDVRSAHLVNNAVEKIYNANGRVDVVVHSAGNVIFGPAEASTPDQLADHFDVNVVSTQRINRAVLPHMRRQRYGLVVWIGCSSSVEGSQPYLSVDSAVKAAYDALAVGYADELMRWGIESCIVVPSATVAGGIRLPQAGALDDAVVSAQYETGPHAGLISRVRELFDHAPSSAEALTVAEALTEVVGSLSGHRAFRVHDGSTGDRAELGFAVLDQLKDETLQRAGLSDVLKSARFLGDPLRANPSTRRTT